MTRKRSQLPSILISIHVWIITEQHLSNYRARLVAPFGCVTLHWMVDLSVTVDGLKAGAPTFTTDNVQHTQRRAQLNFSRLTRCFIL